MESPLKNQEIWEVNNVNFEQYGVWHVHIASFKDLLKSKIEIG